MGVHQKIAEAAVNDEYALVSADGWLAALKDMDDVACEFYMEDKLGACYLWWEEDGYRATELGPGLEDREGRPLDDIEAVSLIDSTSLRKPVPRQEVPDAA